MFSSAGPSSTAVWSVILLLLFIKSAFVHAAAGWLLCMPFNFPTIILSSQIHQPQQPLSHQITPWLPVSGLHGGFYLFWGQTPLEKSHRAWVPPTPSKEFHILSTVVNKIPTVFHHMHSEYEICRCKTKIQIRWDLLRGNPILQHSTLWP